ncbi:MAG: LacI family DNA-binding transcriptional regulator [candidate division KSB1 bacterium]|nr:LacI family DNA-binding transcriptional regulator [candidate division KSB1 bacterium]
MINNNKKIRLKDIADAVGCSVSTVSIVLNGKYKERSISEQVVTQILNTAKKYGYMPNMSARYMRSGQYNMNISLMTSFEAPLVLINAWLISIEKFIEQVSVENMSFTITLTPFHVGHLEKVFSVKDIEAAIIANTNATDDEFLEEASLSMPIVLINRRISDYCTVRLDESAAIEAADVLISQHRKKIAVLKPPFLTQSTKERFDNFTHRVIESGLPRPDVIELEQYNEYGAHLALQAYFKTGGTFDGLFTMTDVLAVGAYKAIKSTGRKIPDDVAVIGFDGLSYAPYLDPPLTTFEVKRGFVYSEAVRILVQMIMNDFRQHVEITYKTKLVKRGSIG